MKDIGAEVEFDLDGAIIMAHGELSPSVDDSIRGFVGYGIGWDISKNGRTIQMSRSEFEPDWQDKTKVLNWQKAEWTMSQFPAWVSGEDYAEDDFVKDAGVLYKVIAGIENSTTAPASDSAHFAAAPNAYDFWFTPQMYRALDMPISAYNAVAVGTSDRPFVTDVFAVDLTYTRVKFRLGSTVDPALHDFLHKNDAQPFLMTRPYIRLLVSGRRALPPKAAAIPCVDPQTQNVNIADIARTYLTAREGGRKFSYGANWTYSRTDTVNNAEGGARMECDTLALMAMLGMRYEDSPYTNLTPNATADFETVMNAWAASDEAAAIPWIQETLELGVKTGGEYTNGLDRRIADQGFMAWWFWDNGYVFRPEVDGVLDLSQLRSGDLVLFRRAPSTFFDNVGHIGVIDVDADGTVYLIHVTSGSTTCGNVVVRSELTEEFFNISPGRYRAEDMYFARIPYGSTGVVEGSYIPAEEDEDEEDEEETED